MSVTPTPRPDEREELYAQIDQERTWQDHRYPKASKTRSEWVTLATKWNGKLADAADRGNHEEFQRRLLQLAAICVQAAEKGWVESEEHEEAPPDLVGTMAELDELLEALEEEPAIRELLEAKGVDVEALLEHGKRPELALLPGGRA